MDDGERKDLVVDVADVLTLNQDVEWDRCARQATPANRRALDNLRLIAGMVLGLPNGRRRVASVAGERAV